MGEPASAKRLPYLPVEALVLAAGGLLATVQGFLVWWWIPANTTTPDYWRPEVTTTGLEESTGTIVFVLGCVALVLAVPMARQSANARSLLAREKAGEPGDRSEAAMKPFQWIMLPALYAVVTAPLIVLFGYAGWEYGQSIAGCGPGPLVCMAGGALVFVGGLLSLRLALPLKEIAGPAIEAAKAAARGEEQAAWSDSRPQSPAPAATTVPAARDGRITVRGAALSVPETIELLVQLYSAVPDGFRHGSEEERPVIEIGEAIDAAGGFDLMLTVHMGFAQRNRWCARNVESAWDGIGSWRG